MRPDDTNQPSLNFFQLAQGLGATIAPSRLPHGDGIGLRSPMLAWQQMQATTPSAVSSVPELPTAQIETVFEEVCGRRGYRPEALLWNTDLASEYFRLVESRLGDLPRRQITRHLLEAHRLDARGNRVSSRGRETIWGHRLRQRSPGCEPAVEWALCRIRYTCGDILSDILDLICDPHLGEAFALLSRAMAPERVREMPLLQARSLLFSKAYGLQRSRKTVVRPDPHPGEQAGVQKVIAGRLTALLNIKANEVPHGRGLVQMNDGDQCLFLCYAADVRATVAEIASGTALNLLARHYWAIDVATLRIGHALADEVMGLGSSTQAKSRDPRSMLQRFEKLLIATMQPTFNWPVRFSDSRGRREHSH